MGRLKKLVDIAWVAGLLEGEGTFGVSNSNSPFFAIQMNDKDVLVKAQLIINAKLYGPYRHKRGDKLDTPHYRLALYGIPAISWMMTVYVFMGERRQKKINSIVRWWIARPALCKGKPKTIIPYDRNTGVLLK